MTVVGGAVTGVATIDVSGAATVGNFVADTGDVNVDNNNRMYGECVFSRAMPGYWMTYHTTARRTVRLRNGVQMEDDGWMENASRRVRSAYSSKAVNNKLLTKYKVQTHVP
jgi:hypothetical protein